jgi:hypothetical protein
MTDGLPGIRRNRDFRESAVYYSDRRRFGRVLHCCAASIGNRRAKRQREPGKPRRRTDQPFDSSCGRTSVSSYPNPSHQIHGGRLAQTFSIEAHLTLRRAFQRNLARRATNVCRPSPTCVEASASMPKSLEMPAAYPAFEPGVVSTILGPRQGDHPPLRVSQAVPRSVSGGDAPESQDAVPHRVDYGSGKRGKDASLRYTWVFVLRTQCPKWVEVPIDVVSFNQIQFNKRLGAPDDRVKIISVLFGV